MIGNGVYPLRTISHTIPDSVIMHFDVRYLSCSVCYKQAKGDTTNRTLQVIKYFSTKLETITVHLLLYCLPPLIIKSCKGFVTEG